MSLKQNKQLLVDVLNNQTENYTHYISYERLEKALTEGPALDGKELEIIWLSPVTRAKFLDIKKALAKQVSQKWQNQSWQEAKEKLAAAGRFEDTHTLDMEQYTLEFYRNDLGWDLILTITEEIAETLTVSTEVWIEDDLGNVWIKGIPGPSNTLSCEWNDDPDKLADYLNRSIKLKHN